MARCASKLRLNVAPDLSTRARAVESSTRIENAKIFRHSQILWVDRLPREMSHTHLAGGCIDMCKHSVGVESISYLTPFRPVMDLNTKNINSDVTGSDSL